MWIQAFGLPRKQRGTHLSLLGLQSLPGCIHGNTVKNCIACWKSEKQVCNFSKAGFPVWLGDTLVLQPIKIAHGSLFSVLTTLLLSYPFVNYSLFK